MGCTRLEVVRRYAKVEMRKRKREKREKDAICSFFNNVEDLKLKLN